MKTTANDRIATVVIAIIWIGLTLFTLFLLL